ncbi:unnamed protein product [Musa acuminata subsp. burmannicoides]
MQRAAAIASTALRRLAASASARPPILARAASSAFSRRLGSSLDFYRPIVRLLPPVDAPSRGYARRREVIPSEEEEEEEEEDEDEDFDDEEDLDGYFDGEGDVDGGWTEFYNRELTDESD